MHAAVGVLTERGGMTSHAAVIGRGLGLPCVVGANGMRIDARDRADHPDGRVFREGDMITVDGTRARCWPARSTCWNRRWTTPSTRCWTGPMRCATSASAPMPTRPPTPASRAISRRRGDRAVPDRAHVLRGRPPDGDARDDLCRHLEDRRAALERLLPMQRADFIRAVRDHAGPAGLHPPVRPAAARVPAAHRDGLRELAEALDKPLSEVTRRAEALAEFNPMLGMRGVRLGITMPEIYDMQARAIFEATVEASRTARRWCPRS
jgi:pyruvate, orthophosphate dikinase